MRLQFVFSLFLQLFFGIASLVSCFVANSTSSGTHGTSNFLPILFAIGQIILQASVIASRPIPAANAPKQLPLCLRSEASNLMLDYYSRLPLVQLFFDI